MKKHEQAAIEAVARHYSAKWGKTEGPPDAYLTIGRKRIAVDAATIKPGIADVAKPRLRFDKGAVGLVSRLQAQLGASVPADRIVMVTVTAPIRQDSKTTAALEERIRTCLTRRSVPIDIEEEIHGNRVRIRLVRVDFAQSSKVIGFVHNPGSGPDILFEIAQLLLASIGRAAGKPAPDGFDRWLVVANAGAFSHIETYRQVYAQLAMHSGFIKILIVFAEGRVETLMER